jgi:hypothetical protein
VNVIPTGGTLKSLYILHRNAPGTDKTVTYTIRRNSSSTGITCSVSNSDLTANDITHTQAVSAGDTVAMMTVSDPAPAAVDYSEFGLCFEATTDGESLVLGSPSAQLDTASTLYNFLGGQHTWSDTASYRHSLGLSCIFKNFYGILEGSPGESKSYTIALVRNDIPTNLDFQIADAATTSNNTSDSVVINAFDTVHLSSTPSNTPTARYFGWGLVSYVFPDFISTASISASLSSTYTPFTPEEISLFAVHKSTNSGVF